MITNRIILHKDHKNFITCFSPADMMELGVFRGRFQYIDHMDHLRVIYNSEDRPYTTPKNAFPDPIYKLDEVLQEVDNLYPEAFRKEFFEWYIGYYYKLTDIHKSKAQNKEMIARWTMVLGEVWETKKSTGLPYYNQILLELAWDFRRNPKTILL